MNKENTSIKKKHIKGNVVWKESTLGIITKKPIKIYRKLFLTIARSNLITPRFRCKIWQLLGVKFSNVKTVFIGYNVHLEGLYPELLFIGENVIITVGVKIITHFYDTNFKEHAFYKGNVTVEDNVFIGMGAIIAAPVTIGKGAVIGANSVVVNDVKPNTIVGGVPAKEIGKRGEKISTNLSFELGNE